MAILSDLPISLVFVEIITLLTLFDGLKLSFALGQPFVKEFVNQRKSEIEEVEFVKQFVEPGDILLIKKKIDSKLGGEIKGG